MSLARLCGCNYQRVLKQCPLPVQPFLRRIITRLIGLIPSVVVAIAVGRTGIDTLLVASQVALALVLPFVAAPLIWLTSSKSVMSVRKPPSADTSTSTVAPSANTPVTSPTLPSPDAMPVPLPDVIEETEVPTMQGLSPLDEKEKVTVEVEKHERHTPDVEDASVDEDACVSFASGWLVTVIAYLIFLIILAANFYAIVMLALGKT